MDFAECRCKALDRSKVDRMRCCAITETGRPSGRFMAATTCSGVALFQLPSNFASGDQWPGHAPRVIAELAVGGLLRGFARAGQACGA